MPSFKHVQTLLLVKLSYSPKFIFPLMGSISIALSYVLCMCWESE